MNNGVMSRARRRAAGVLLVCQLAAGTASALVGIDQYSRGAGPDSFKIAIITDMHIGNGGADSCLQNVVDTLNALYGATGAPILVVVTGDFVNCLDSIDDAHWNDTAVSKLNQLEMPWVPVMGNHDALFSVRIGDEAPLTGPEWSDGSGVQDVFWTRGFHRLMREQYARLEALYADPLGAGPISGFQRYRELPLNREMEGWPSPFAGAHDAFEQCAFRAGPSGSPYYFLCLDFNSRSQAQVVGGLMPRAELTTCSFNDSAVWVRAYGRDGCNDARCTLYVDAGYTGGSLQVLSQQGDLQLTGGWAEAVSSLTLDSLCDSVALTNAASGRRVFVRSEPNLDLLGPVGWWLARLRDYAATPANDGQYDKVIVFAHNAPNLAGYHTQWFYPPFGLGLDFGAGFDPTPVWGEQARLLGLLDPYRDRVGGWFSGQIIGDANLFLDGWTGCG